MIHWLPPKVFQHQWTMFGDSGASVSCRYAVKQLIFLRYMPRNSYNKSLISPSNLPLKTVVSHHVPQNRLKSDLPWYEILGIPASFQIGMAWYGRAQRFDNLVLIRNCNRISMISIFLEIHWSLFYRMVCKRFRIQDSRKVMQLHHTSCFCMNLFDQERPNGTRCACVSCQHLNHGTCTCNLMQLSCRPSYSIP